MPGVEGRARLLTLRVLRGDEGLDEGIGALGVERQSVAQRGQLGTLLHKGLLQAVPSSVEVLLHRAGRTESIDFQVSSGLNVRVLVYPYASVPKLHFKEQRRETSHDKILRTSHTE